MNMGEYGGGRVKGEGRESTVCTLRKNGGARAKVNVPTCLSLVSLS